MNGKIKLADFKKIIRKTIFLTPKEKNLIIREIRDQEVDYTKFKEMVYQCRFQISVAKIMDTNLSDIEQIIMDEFIVRDAEEDGLA